MKELEKIRLKCAFGSLHAEGDEITLKLKLPKTEGAAAGLFPLMSEIVFDAVFTPSDVQPDKGGV